jgi:transcriptional regulator with XRE-family HTH domain
MPSNLEEKVAQCLAATNLTMSQLAAKMGLLEPELTTLCRHGDPRLSELEHLAHCLRVPPTYFLGSVTQTGAFNQAGNGNTLKIKIGKSAARQLVAQLSVCQHALHSAHELVAAKEEIIGLLRGSCNNTN